MAKPDDETEWIELYNPTDQIIDLTGWQIKDGNTSISDDLTLSGQIDPLGFKTFDHSKGWLNDSGGETVTLLNGSSTIDSYTYTTATQGKTFGRKPDGESWVNNLTATKNSTNNDPSSSTPTPTPTPEPTSTPSSSSSTFTISSIPSNINADQSFSVTINLSLPNNVSTDYFLKGAFKIKDGSRYLGLTKVSGDWKEYADDYTDQYKITTDSSGNWTGDLEVKPDTNDKDYKGGGDYIFKVGRYPSGGSVTWSNEQTVHITDNQSTPIPTPTPKPSVALATISSTKSAINNATSSASSSNTPQLPILGLSTSSAEASPEAYGDFKQSKNPGIAMIIGGLIIIVSAAGVYLRYKHTHVESNS